MNLYWVETADGAEDWFVVARARGERRAGTSEPRATTAATLSRRSCSGFRSRSRLPKAGHPASSFCRAAPVFDAAKRHRW